VADLRRGEEPTLLVKKFDRPVRKTATPDGSKAPSKSGPTESVASLSEPGF
jgi:hypothetical protein